MMAARMLTAATTIMIPLQRHQALSLIVVNHRDPAVAALQTEYFRAGWG
jgi:hypothetical protein